MRFISSILLIVLMGISVFIAPIYAQPTGAVYVNSSNDNGSTLTRKVTDGANVRNTTNNVKPNNNRANLWSYNLNSAYLHLNFPQAVTGSSSNPVTVYIRTNDASMSLIGTSLAVKAYNNTSGETNPATITNTNSYYLHDGTVFIAVVVTGTFQSVRLTLTAPLLSEASLDVYYAFYSTTPTNTSNPYPFNASDCGLPNVTTKQDVIQLLAEYKVINPGNAIDGDTVSHSSFTNNGVVLGNTIMKQTFYFNSYSNQSDAIRIVLSRSGSILAANLIAGIELRAYNGETLVSSTQLANVLLDADLLGLLNGNKRATIYYYPKQSNGQPFIFDRLELSFNIDLLGVALGSNALNVHDVRRVPGAPSVPVTSTVCTNVGTVLLSAVSALEGTVNNLSFNWYTGLRGGNSLITNKQYTPTGLTTAGNRSYYVDVTKPGCPLPSARHQVNLNIVNAPATPPINLIP